MTVSFPISLPSSPAISSINWRQVNTTGVSRSPFTLQQQVYEWPGDSWAIDVGIDSMDREEVAPWIAALSSLRGQRGTFQLGDVLSAISQGSPGGTPLVNGASQTGYSLVTDGWTISTLVLKAGDRIQVDSSLYMVSQDVTSDGSGNATIDLWPSLRGHANNAAIVYTNAKGLFRLSGRETIEPIGRSQLWTLAFSAIEAL